MEAFLDTPFLQPYHFFRLTLIFFIIVFMRYLIVSGLYHYLFYVWFRPKVAHRILNLKSKEQAQIRMEIKRSALTSVIFAFSATALIILWQNGFTQITTDWAAFPWWYHPVSLFIALFIHETYYYWLHRWMHLPKIYRKVHKWHHDSIETSSLTSFSFFPPYWVRTPGNCSSCYHPVFAHPSLRLVHLAIYNDYFRHNQSCRCGGLPKIFYQ